jgi:hypothetical protein
MRTKIEPIDNLPLDYRRRKFVKLEVPISGWIVPCPNKTRRIERRLLC